jgi:hypothetical protein
MAVTERKNGVTSFHWSPDGLSVAYLAKDDDSPATGGRPSGRPPQLIDADG